MNYEDTYQLQVSYRKSRDQFEASFSKTRFKLYPTVETYVESIKLFFEKITFEHKTMVSSKGSDFHFFHLTTQNVARTKFLDNIFSYPYLKIDKLGADMMFCNSIIAYIVAFNITYILHVFETYMQGYKYIPIRWTHVTREEKTVFLSLPKGEVTYFINKGQHEEKYSLPWFKCLLEEPLVFYKMGNKRFSVTKDLKTLREGKIEMAITGLRKPQLQCWQHFILWNYIDKFINKCENMQAGELSFLKEIMLSGMEERFWYFTPKEERSSTTWANPQRQQ